MVGRVRLGDINDTDYLRHHMVDDSINKCLSMAEDSTRLLEQLSDSTRANEYYNNEQYSEAARLYRKLMYDGFTEAYFPLGLMSYHGLGKPRDIHWAEKRFKRGAELGNVRAMTYLVRVHKRVYFSS
jgi:TPR repeat protein